MNPVRAALRYPQVTLFLAALVFMIGVYSIARMPRREDPKVTIRTGIVAAAYPGATGQEVEDQVTRKIEEHLFHFAEVRREKTYSTKPNSSRFKRARWAATRPQNRSPETTFSLSSAGKMRS